MNRTPPTLLRHQQGAALFIALIVLLMVTLLAVTSMRGVVLEARITGNLLEHKRLTNAAESALRESEKRIANHPRPLDMCSSDNTETACIQGPASDYDVNFTSATAYSGIDGSTTLERNAYWYIRDTGIISSTDPDCFLTGKNCVSYYEVNSQATTSDAVAECGADALCIRSVVAALYD